MSALMVIAKAPVPGTVKTRLVPPCTPEQAAELASAALDDTIAAMVSATATRRVAVLAGSRPDGLPGDFEVVMQRGDGLGERLACAFADIGGDGFVIAMDTPQVTPALLDQALARLARPDVDAVIGPAPDGGYWGIGFAGDGAGAFAGVPMSAPGTYAAQCERLDSLGLRVAVLPVLRDVDTIDDARMVAAQAPGTRFAAALRASGHAGDEDEPVSEAAA